MSLSLSLKNKIQVQSCHENYIIAFHNKSFSVVTWNKNGTGEDRVTGTGQCESTAEHSLVGLEPRIPSPANAHTHARWRTHTHARTVTHTHARTLARTHIPLDCKKIKNCFFLKSAGILHPTFLVPKQPSEILRTEVMWESEGRVF